MLNRKPKAPDPFLNIDKAMDSICIMEDVIGYTIKKVLSPNSEILYELNIHLRDEGLIKIAIPAMVAINATEQALLHQIMYGLGWRKEVN